MAHLSLSFLGRFEVTFDAEPITAFGSDKARALLAFLSIESSRPHRRAKLSGMFWPDLPENKAAHNLSQSLLRLRQALGGKKDLTVPSVLIVTPQHIQFNTNSSHQLDVARFRELLNRSKQHTHPKTANCRVCMQWLQQAAELYHGDLLAGLFVSDSVAFEEWRMIQQEELRRQALETLTRLAAYHEQCGEFERAQDYAQRQVALEPWREEAHLQLMRVMSQSGQTSAALRQYEHYQRALAEELNLKPSADITKLYEQICSSGEGSQVVAQSGVGGAVWLADQGERRQVTTLICNHHIMGDSEEGKEQIAHCEQYCGAIFNRFGGRRALRQGEVCLVYFGYPQAFEDAARRAVHSSLALASALEGNGHVQIGIHTGVVTVGKKQGRRWQDRDLFGTTLEVARDCQRMAGAGEILITENVRRLVQEFFDLQALGVRSLETAGQSLPVYSVHGESSARNRLEWLTQTQRLTVFTGREEHLTLLAACYENAIQGKGQVVLLSGEPGIGKSRLIWELKNSVQTSFAPYTAPPVLWLDSHCLPHYQNTSLYPIIGLLEGLIGFQADDSLKVRQEKLAGMLAGYNLNRPSTIWLLSILLGLPVDTPTPETITKAQREQMREVFVALLQKRAAVQPLVLVVEDLHWGDPTTVDWLGQSIASLASVSCLIVLTARPAFNPAWLSNTDSRSNLLLLPLSPLHSEQAKQLVTDLAGERALDEEIRRDIISRTDGNPLFIEEMTKSLIEDAAVKGDIKAKAKIPATLLDSLTARLDHLDAAKETAQWAAVLGREFSYPILQACVPYDEQRLQSDLTRLIENELVLPVNAASSHSATEYTFKHALIQEAAYVSMLKNTRQVSHRRVAETLETRFPQIAETQPEILAQHYSNADMKTKAVDFWLQAGERAITQGATLEASIFFGHAIEWIEIEDSGRRWQAFWGRETVLNHRGERESQKEDIATLLELAETLNDDTHRALAQMRLARFATSQSDYRGQSEAAEAAILAAKRAGNSTVELEALAYKVTALMRLGERVTVHQVVERMLAQIQKVEDDNIRAYASAAVAIYYVENGDLTRAIQFLNQSLESAKHATIRHLDLESQYHGHLGFAYIQLGLYTQACDTLVVGLELANLMGIDRYQAYHMINLGFVYWRIGDLKAAAQMEEQALKEYSATGEAFGHAGCQAYLGYIYEEEGNLALAAEYLTKARGGFSELGVDADRFEAQAVEARVALAQGRREDAKKLTKEVWNYLCEHGTEGLGSPSWLYVCVADVLDVVEISNISMREVVETGYRELMQRAEKVSNPEWRQSFLENVAENRIIIERWEKMNKAEA